jgi:Tol biopolymer transport system component
MELSRGSTLGPYEITREIGRGGMGVVFLARDPRLDRNVALKALPEYLTNDAERLARFELEGKSLAQLNHPNVASIYGVEEQDERKFLILEYVEGDTLGDRLQCGTIPVDEALELATQIAAGLEAAHEVGVVHRDLKPDNIKITPAGQIKVLDFGLAKSSKSGSAVTDRNAPTITSPVQSPTSEGTILGTAPYMSPEQASGKPVDKRTDVWAFGCVLYECLTGQRAFAGNSITVFAAILEKEPDWSLLPANTPPTLYMIIRRCLSKDLRKRLRDIGDVRIVLEDLADGSDSFALSAAGLLPTEDKTGGRTRWIWLCVTALVLVCLAGSVGWFFRPAPTTPDPMVSRFVIPASGLNFDAMPKLSPDGRRIAYTSNDGICIRDLSQLVPRVLEDSRNATVVFWSPDSANIGWRAEGKIWRSPIADGAKTAVCDVPIAVQSACWGENDRIVFATGKGPMYEVSARGGNIRTLFDLAADEDESIEDPSFLPDGRGLVFKRTRIGATFSDTIEVLVDGKRKTVLQIDGAKFSQPQVSENGFLLYERLDGNDGLWAAPFSLTRFEVTGDPVLVDSEAMAFSISDNGSLLYAGLKTTNGQLVWVDRNGQTQETIGLAQLGLRWPAISKDGQRIAVGVTNQGRRDLWVYDSITGNANPLTFGDGSYWAPAWFPDGTHVTVGRGSRSIVTVTTDGSEEVTEIAEGEWVDVSPDGETIAFERRASKTDDDVYLVRTSGDLEPELVLQTNQDEQHVQISPDGNYLAYTTYASGRAEVYITRYPSGKGKWKASFDGGNWSRWNPAGGELFFLSGGWLMAVDVELESTPRIGTPRKLFNLEAEGLSELGREYDVAPDGQRFVMVRPIGRSASTFELVFVENWAHDLN